MEPFDTFGLFPTPIRILYWASINLVAWIATPLLSALFFSLLPTFTSRPSKWAELTSACLAGCASAFPIAGATLLANSIAEPYSNQAAVNFADKSGFWQLVLYIAPLTILISALFILWRHNQAPFPEGTTATTEQDKTEGTTNTHHPFFDRLPKHLGRDLISLSSQDHYLEVRTKHGKELILMRLGDAVKELSDYDGAQIHRSHWVADQAVDGIITEDSRQFAILTTGERLPISRTYRQVPRNRGWTSHTK
ncbi:MAG: LytTR family transcriptional regulator [Cohaesibacter sp.]|nr:LytTR family transcriptional regulator [Cohaesibacter sp.]